MAWTWRMWSPLAIILTSLALLAGLSLGEGAPTDEGNGSPPDDGEWETEGNWTVEEGESLIYEDLTLIVNGNLTVKLGGNLTLRGTKLIMACEEDLQYHVHLEPDSEMVLIDLDGLRSTTFDRSELRSDSLADRYTFRVDKAARLTVVRSLVADMGRDLDTGLEILSSDVLFEDSVVEEFDSIYVHDAAPVFRHTRLTGTLLSNVYFRDSWAVIDGCTIINCYHGINALGPRAPSVNNTTIANCAIPLNLVDASLAMRGGMLEAYEYGTDVVLNVSSRAVLVDVDFNKDNVAIEDGNSELEVRWTLRLRVTDHSYQPLEAATVEVNDSSKVRVFKAATGPDGRLDIELVDYIQDMTGNETLNPYTVLVTKDRYRSGFVVNITSTMIREVTLTTNLPPVIEIVSPRPGTRLVMDQELELDASPTYDPNGELDQLTYRWTTDLDDRLLYEGPEATAMTTLVWGETEVTLTVTDDLGASNSTTVPVQVLQASATTLTLSGTAYNATLSVTFGGPGTVLLDELDYQTYDPELIGIFLWVHVSGDAILAFGELKVEYGPVLLPFGMDEGTITLVREDGGRWLDVPGSSVDILSHTVTATIHSFGMYAVRGSMPSNVPPRIGVTEGGEFVPAHDVSFSIGEAIDLVFTVQDELPDFATLDAEDLPEFLRLDRSSKRIWGTAPNAAGQWLLNLTATDMEGSEATASIWLEVTGRPSPPGLYSMVIDPTKGDVDTVFEVKVLYQSPDDRAPVFVRLEIDEDTYELVPIDPTDTNYPAGVLYHTFIQLDSGTHPLVFNVSDGVSLNRTGEVLTVEVEQRSFKPTELELAIILMTGLAIAVVLAIIHMTSERYKKLKDAHLGRDLEGRIDYITPGKEEMPEKGPEEGDGEEEDVRLGVDEDEVPEDDDDEQDLHVVTEPGTLNELDSEVERLEDELSEIDGELDEEEEEISKIDEEIEEIIDELDEDQESTR